MSAHPLYRQDVIAPTAVHHRLEFGDRTPGRPGEFGHWYNYLDYEFEDAGSTLRARHYLDEPGTALLLSECAGDAFTLRVLVFLSMRFDALKCLGDAGYRIVPRAIMEQVDAMREAHLEADPG